MPSLRRLLLVAGAALALAGCGGGGSSGGTGGTTSVTSAPARGPQPPRGASRVLKQVYQQFPAPRSDPRVRGSAQAVKAGERACQDRTPAQVKTRYYPAATAQGRIKPKSPQAQMIARIASLEKHPSAAFAAGQLAAGTYQATLREPLAAYGYRGCIYALARGLERRLAP